MTKKQITKALYAACARSAELNIAVHTAAQSGSVLATMRAQRAADSAKAEVDRLVAMSISAPSKSDLAYAHARAR